jgi:hypothetical protein
MVDITEISAVVAAGGVLIGVIYYVSEIRHQNKLRRTDLVKWLYSFWTNSEFMEAFIEIHNLRFKDYEDFVKTYGPPFSKNPVYLAFYKVINYFDEAGSLLRKGLIDIDVVSDIGIAVFLWEKLKPIVEGHRRELARPGFMGSFEYLYNEMKKQQLKK